MTLPYNIVILPTDNLAQKAINVSQQLQQFGTLFTLKDGEYFPHVSLYMVQLNVTSLNSMRELLAEIAARTPQFDLIAPQYCQAEGYIDVDYQRSKVLDALQMAIIEAINPILDGMRAKDKTRILGNRQSP